MPWFQVDDSAPDHPKFIRAGYAAWALFVAGLAYCSRHHTDGRIPKEAVPGLLVTMPRSVRARAVTALCSNGDPVASSLSPDRALTEPQSRPDSDQDSSPSWVDLGTHFLVHNIEEYQETKAERDLRRQQDRERQRAWRAANSNGLSRRDKQRDNAARHAVTNASRARATPTTQLKNPPVAPLTRGANGNSSSGRKPRRLTGVAKENAAIERREPAAVDLERMRDDVLSCARFKKCGSGLLEEIADAGTVEALGALLERVDAS
jgi:hypothetical protein